MRVALRLRCMNLLSSFSSSFTWPALSRRVPPLMSLVLLEVFPGDDIQLNQLKLVAYNVIFGDDDHCSAVTAFSSFSFHKS